MVREPRTYDLVIEEENIEIDWLVAKGMLDRGEAILIDLRTKKEEDEEIKDAIKVDNVDDIFLYKIKFDPGKKYILLDDLGETARVLARYLRSHGIEAYSVKGGYKAIKLMRL